jgi:hypothetical protein
MSWQARRRLAAVAVFGAAVSLAAAPPAAGEVGVAINIGAIHLEEAVDHGRTYRLPIITVRNPADEPATYRMGAGGVENDGLQDFTSGWFRFQPSEFRLDPGGIQPVTTTLVIADDAAPGRYLGLVRAEAAPGGSGGIVGAAAGAELTFTVTEASDVGALLRGIGHLVAASMPWSLAVVLVLMTTLGGRWARSRFRIRLERR